MKSLSQRMAERDAARMGNDVAGMTGHSLVPATPLSPVHQQFVHVINDLMSFCEQSIAAADSPAPLRTALAMIKRLNSTQLAPKIGEIDPMALVTIARELRDKLDTIVIASLPLQTGPQLEEGHGDAAALPRADQPA